MTPQGTEATALSSDSSPKVVSEIPFPGSGQSSPSAPCPKQSFRFPDNGYLMSIINGRLRLSIAFGVSFRHAGDTSFLRLHDKHKVRRLGNSIRYYLQFLQSTSNHKLCNTISKRPVNVMILSNGDKHISRINTWVFG